VKKKRNECNPHAGGANATPLRGEGERGLVGGATVDAPEVSVEFELVIAVRARADAGIVAVPFLVELVEGGLEFGEDGGVGFREVGVGHG